MYYVDNVFIYSVTQSAQAATVSLPRGLLCCFMYLSNLYVWIYINVFMYGLKVYSSLVGEEGTCLTLKGGQVQISQFLQALG